MSAFQLNDAYASYNGANVLSEITLTIDPGERVALIGESGAGKSTLLNVLYAHRSEKTAWVPQDFGLVRSLSVFHNVYMGRLKEHPAWYNLVNLVRPFHADKESVRAVLERVGLTDKMATPTGELSGGQKQRTAVARALYQGGDVLLGDEPVSALDERQAGAILEAINQGFETVVLAMHDVELALRHTTRVIGISDGNVQLDEPSARLSVTDLLENFYT